MSPSRELSRRGAAIAGLLALVAIGANLPVPMVLLYQDRFDLSRAGAAGLFGVYAAGLVPSVLAAGPLSDLVGPRRIMIAGGLVSVAASAGFALAHGSITALFAVRAVQGIAAGAVFTVGSAWLQRLWEDARGRGARRAAVSMTGGFAAGSLVGGVWGEWFSAPLIAPFVTHGICCLVASLIICTLPETREVQAAAPRGGHLRAGTRRHALLVVAPPALFVFGFPATAINAVPLFVDLPGAPVAVTGFLAAMTLGIGAVAAPWQARLGERTVPTAALMGAFGMLTVAFAVTVPVTFPVLIPGCVALGAGGGLALSGGLARIPDIARAPRQGGVTAGFYAVAYAGFGIPVLITKVALPPQWSFVVLASLCFVVWCLQRGRGAPADQGADDREPKYRTKT